MSRKMHNYIQSRNYSTNKVWTFFCEYPPPLSSCSIYSRHHRTSLFRLYILKIVPPLSPIFSLFYFTHRTPFYIPFQNTTSIPSPLLDLRQKCLTVHNPGTLTSPRVHHISLKVQGRTGDPLYPLNDSWWWSWCRKIIKTSAHSSGRIAQACDRCRSKKIKCDGKLPQVLIPHTNHRSSLGWLRSAHNVSMSALNVRRRINWADGHSLEVTPRH